MNSQKQLSILVVDDEEGLRNTIAFDLKRKGFKVFFAENGTRAYEIATTESIDLVLSDITMPDGNGIELLRRLKERNRRIPPVILMTGFTQFSHQEACAMGAEAVIVKPFERKLLMDAILRALETGKRDGELSIAAANSAA